MQLTSQGFNGLPTAGLNNGKTKTFTITGGGANFQLGSKVNQTNKASIGISDVSTGSLGDGVGRLPLLAGQRRRQLAVQREPDQRPEDPGRRPSARSPPSAAGWARSRSTRSTRP